MPDIRTQVASTRITEKQEKEVLRIIKKNNFRKADFYYDAILRYLDEFNTEIGS